jgi:alpha-glucosidase
MLMSTRLPHYFFSGLLALFGAAALLAASNARGAADSWTLDSPSSRLQVKVEQNDGMRYSVLLRGQQVIAPSQIDLKVAHAGWLGRQAEKPTATRESRSETLDFVVPRKYRQLRTKYNELRVTFASGAVLVFRAYDEGAAYRWETNLPGVIKVEDELAQFLFSGHPKSWFPEEESMMSHQERVYKYLPLADVTPQRFCSTGVLIDLLDGRKVYLSESDLRSYPGMFLRGVGNGQIGLVGKYAPYPLENKAKPNSANGRDVEVTKAADYLAQTKGTRTFPWRLAIVTEQDTELLQSELVFALAPPPELKDTSWIKPGKAVWDWWCDIQLTGVDFRAGVNTETYKYFIDFASEYGIEYLLIDEGWCADSADVLSERQGFSLKEIVDYANQKNVKVLLWMIWNALDRQLVPAMDKFERLGVAGIKVDFMQRDDQWMVDFYDRVAREAAKHHLLVDFHGACKPTGLRRALPNVMTREGVTGMEQYKWSDQAANPKQELVLPFVRMVAGPMDFTPGAMLNSNKENWRYSISNPMSLGTRCHQLAMYVVYESPLQMLCDSPTRYRKEPECMKFLSAVPTVWDDTIALQAKVSDYVVIARRSGDQWYLGAMTDWDKRELKVPLNFLPEGIYQLDSWADGVNADRDGTDFRYSTSYVSAADTVTLNLAPGGGWAGRLRPTVRMDSHTTVDR